jgi:hypothetical protein
MLFDPKWEEKIAVKELWRQVLREAAEVIKQRGWIQGRLRDKQGRVCAIGAISHVFDTDLALRCGAVGAEQNLRKYLSIDGGDEITIASWNDKPGRTKEEVVQAMLHVADE